MLQRRVGWCPGGVRSVKITDLMPLGAVWTPEEGTRAFDPGLFGE